MSGIGTTAVRGAGVLIALALGVVAWAAWYSDSPFEPLELRRKEPPSLDQSANSPRERDVEPIAAQVFQPSPEPGQQSNPGHEPLAGHARGDAPDSNTRRLLDDFGMRVGMPASEIAKLIDNSEEMELVRLALASAKSRVVTAQRQLLDAFGQIAPDLVAAGQYDELSTNSPESRRGVTHSFIDNGVRKVVRVRINPGEFEDYDLAEFELTRAKAMAKDELYALLETIRAEGK